MGVTAVVGAAFQAADGTPRITSVACQADGNVRVAFKAYLHGVERGSFAAGSEVPTLLDVEGWRVALAVCYDVAVPKHAVSALYTQGQERRLDLHLGARAMDHSMYTVLANLAGRSHDWVSYGRSGVWSPDSRPLLVTGVEEGLVVVTLQLRDHATQAGSAFVVERRSSEGRGS